MNRFFVSPTDIDLLTKEISISGEDVKHITKVLRLSNGDLIEVCDGEAFEYIAEIKNISKNQVILSIQEQLSLKREAPIDVILYQSIPKSTKMELIIQKTTEMGIKEVVPVMTERTIVQFKDKKDVEKKIDRWQKISAEAAKQSKRGKIPSIHLPIPLHNTIIHAKENDLNIIAYEKEDATGLKDIIAALETEHIKRIGIWIGPEGGFTEEEIHLATKNNIKSITLGPRILRTETAGLAALSILMYALGDLGG
ncbi:16S rRNA (uracil(1498)-N(3))-methyltransferase [Natronincola peptidivorans]|nr:16S rRNA (uracil(1498)-N(3))-methyltransferase [Natronincola peptidivorans]